jgi:Gpi18-like mannosyltransferase
MGAMDDVTAEKPTPLQILIAIFKKRPTFLIPVVFFLALIIRIILLPNKGFEADISFWKSWGLAVYDHGIVWGIENTNNNYPTAFAYVLGLMTWVYSLFADPHNFYEYWSNNNLLFMTISKMPSVLADFGIAGIILWIGKNTKKVHFPQLPFSFYALLAFAYLLNPIVIIDGAWWGQVDSVGVFVFFVAFLLAVRRMPFLAGFVYMASMMTKLQNMIYGPAFFIFLWQFNGFSGLIKGVAGTMTAFFGLNFEFFLARKMGLVFESLTANYDYFPFLSLNAYNLWWIVAKANGMHTLDRFSTIGIANAKSIGLAIFSSFYLIAIVLMIKETIFKMFKKSVDPTAIADPQTILYRFFTALMLIAGGFFLFQTESHDRYAFPMTLFFPMWATFFLATAITKVQRLDPYKTKVFKVLGISYLIFAVFYFYNLHTALVVNYPQNGIPLLKELVQPVFTITDSVILLALFGAYLWAVARHVSATWFIIPVLSCAILIGIPNLPLLTKKPVSINVFKPIISQQGYGTRQVDMPVNAFNGFDSWGSLSVQYAFYKHGIGTHSKSYHMYHVNKLFRWFSVDVGIDTEAGGKGTSSFEVYGDDKLLFKYDKIGRFEYPKHMNINIVGVTRLGLVTNDAGDGINDDHTDWLNPQLWP